MSEVDNVKFNGDKLFRNRQDRGLSQGKLAAKIGVSRQTIYLWESNQSLPDVEKVGKICKILKINLSDLMDGVEEQKTLEDSRSISDNKETIVELKGDSENNLSDIIEVSVEPINETDNIIEEDSNEITALILKKELPKKRKSKKVILKIVIFVLLIALIIHIILSTIKFARLNIILDKWKKLDKIESYYIEIKEIQSSKSNKTLDTLYYEIYYNNSILKTIIKDSNNEKINMIIINDYNNKEKYVINEKEKTYIIQTLDKNNVKLTDIFDDYFFMSNNNWVNYLVCLRPDVNILYNEVYELNIGNKKKEYIERDTGLITYKEDEDNNSRLIRKHYAVDLNTSKDFEINLDEYTEIKREN